MRLPWWGVVCVIIGAIPIAWLFDRIGRFELALPTLDSVGVLGIAIAMKWQLRRHVWFWATMTVFAALHGLLILFVPWTTKWVPASVCAGIATVDLYAMLAILFVAGKFLEKPNDGGWA